MINYGDYSNKILSNEGQGIPINFPDKGNNLNVFTSINDPTQVSTASLKIFSSSSSSTLLTETTGPLLTDHNIKQNTNSHEEPKPNGIAKSVMPDIVQFNKKSNFENEDKGLNDIQAISKQKEIAEELKILEKNGSDKEVNELSEEFENNNKIDFVNYTNKESTENISSKTTGLSREEILKEIEAMDEDALMEAYDDPSYSDYIQEISDELERKIQEGIQNDEKLIVEKQYIVNDTQQLKTELSQIEKTESYIEQAKNTQATQVEEIGERMATALEKNLLFLTEEGKLQKPSMANGPIRGIVSFDPESGVLKAPKELLKNFSTGQKIEVEDEMGIREVKISKKEALSDEELKELHTFITNNNFRYEPTMHEDDIHEKEKSFNKSSDKEIKLKESENKIENEKNNAATLSGERTSKTQASQDSFTLSPSEAFFKRLKKFEEKANRIEKEIKREIENNEIKRTEKNRTVLKQDIEKINISLQELKLEKKEIENEYKNFLMEENNGIIIPSGIKTTIKEIMITLKNINGSAELLKKETESISLEEINTAGILRTKGRNTEGRTEN